MDLGDRGQRRLKIAHVVVGRRSIEDLDRKHPTFHGNDRYLRTTGRPDDRTTGLRFAGKIAGESFGSNRRRSNHDDQFWAAGAQSVEETEEEIDVEAALVGLVDDDRFVA